MKKIIIYDFDGTLTPYPLPKLEILKKCGLNDITTNHEFLKKVKEKSENENIDTYLAMYQTLFEIINKSNIELIDENLCLGSKDVEYNPGVFEFLDYLNKLNIKNYLVSSGLKPFLNKTDIAKKFTKIYATTFKYQNNKIIDIGYLMSDKKKVEAIKEIIRENNTNPSNIIYIGDGLSDYYAFEYIHKNNGTTILLQNHNEINPLLEKVISFKTTPDYSINSKLYNYITNQIS